MKIYVLSNVLNLNNTWLFYFKYLISYKTCHFFSQWKKLIVLINNKRNTTQTSTLICFTTINNNLSSYKSSLAWLSHFSWLKKTHRCFAIVRLSLFLESNTPCHSRLSGFKSLSSPEQNSTTKSTFCGSSRTCALDKMEETFSI